MYLLDLTLTTLTKRRLTVGLPVLAGFSEETLFRDAQPVGALGPYELQKAGNWTIGRASLPVDRGIEVTTRDMYAGLFAAADGLNLCRVWHYVPRINEAGPGGLENYRAFCHGRSLAFEAHFGKEFEQRLPSASAVGTEDTRITVVFAACEARPMHFENPEQISAYHYPKNYGPRSPSFSRASVVARGAGAADVFISGTAAIVGHESVASGNLAGQIDRTVRNLRLISRVCGMGEDLGQSRGGERHFKVYIRRASELDQVREALDIALLQWKDKVSYLRSDICRAELALEIEATVLGVRVGE